MSLYEPTLYDLNYQQLLDEALARVRVHTPEWTNFNESDPGVTLLQLFAFMAESVAYRTNLVPERNRLKFLQLLGIPLQTAKPAQGMVTFSYPRGPVETQTLLDDLELFAGQVPFRTRNGLDVLPIEGAVYYKARPALPQRTLATAEAQYNQLYASYQAPNVELRLYETQPLPAPINGAPLPTLDLSQGTVDGCLWLALLARKPDEVESARQALTREALLTLGIVPALQPATRVLLPEGEGTAEVGPALRYEHPTAVSLRGTPQVTYTPLEPQPQGDVLAEPGVVELSLPPTLGTLSLTLANGNEQDITWDKLESYLDPLEAGTGSFPPSLEDTDVLKRVITWLRIRLDDRDGAPSRLSARFNHLCVNAAMVTQRAQVFSENVGRGTGAPDQSFALVHNPVIPDSLTLTIDGEIWTRIDDLAVAGSEVPGYAAGLPTALQPSPTTRAKVYALDEASGTIRFGDGHRGARPPRDALIQASYAYGGGLQGMVGVEAIKNGPLLPAGVKVRNPLPTWGANEAESVSQAVRRIPKYLQHRDRLVAADDFKAIAERTPGADVGRCEVLPLFHPELGDYPAEGTVTLMVLPSYDPLHPEAPVPDLLFLNTITDYLAPRRLLTTELHVRGPVYVPVACAVGISVVAGRDPVRVREAVENILRTFLSPLDGGFEESGWPLDRAVEALELIARAAQVPGVAKVNGLVLAPVGGAPTGRIPMKGLQLPRLDQLSVQVGTPPTRATLQNAVPAPKNTAHIVPVPFTSPSC